MAARVAVDSAIGEGSCFTVWLPLRAPVAAASAAAEPPLLPAATALAAAGVALMVEDDLKSAELVRLQLEGEGFTVLHAVIGRSGNGAGGATAADADHPRHHAARNGRMGIPGAHQAGSRR